MTPSSTHPATAAVDARRLDAGRVLIAEDDLEMRRLLAMTLRKEGYDVVEATNGSDLIYQFSEAASRAPINCIVTDVRMPKIGGLQALRFLRDEGIDVPVLVITAFGDNVTRVEAWTLGASAVLDKPFDMSDLVDEISRLRTSGLWGRS